jgi:methyl-accepting chemotaxis protein
MKVLSQIKLRTKLILLMAMSGLALSASIGVGVTLIRERMIEDRVATLRAAVSLVMGLARSLEMEVAANTLTREQALEELRVYLHVARFGGQDDYLVVLSEDGKVLVHGFDPRREGKPAAVSGANGRSLTQMAQDLLKTAPGGTISFLLPRVGVTAPEEKLAYGAGSNRGG